LLAVTVSVKARGKLNFASPVMFAVSSTVSPLAKSLLLKAVATAAIEVKEQPDGHTVQIAAPACRHSPKAPSIKKNIAVARTFAATDPLRKKSE